MEYWDAYDAQGNPTGGILVRGEEIPEGVYHLVASVLVQHTDGTYLLMKRHPDKPNHPGVYEASAGGSVLSGETAMEAARRELQEETGIRAGELKPLYEESAPGRIYHCFLCLTDCSKDSVTLQEGETVGYRWVDLETLKQMRKETPSSVILHQGLLSYLKID
ncbi:MAG: NUDIX hydrolase [Clostridiales bacterium]|nr:NUDIX hydrolase [Clostridiales bacterium]